LLLQKNPLKERRLTKPLQTEPLQKELLPKLLLKELLHSRRNALLLQNALLKDLGPLLHKLLQHHRKHQHLWCASVLFNTQELLTKRSAQIDWRLRVASLGKSLANC
jgi:hypothetical protein